MTSCTRSSGTDLAIRPDNDGELTFCADGFEYWAGHNAGANYGGVSLRKNCVGRRVPGSCPIAPITLERGMIGASRAHLVDGVGAPVGSMPE